MAAIRSRPTARDSGRPYDAMAMSPALLLTFLVAGLVALIPVWRLHVAGWPPRSLFTAWILYAVGILVAVRFPGPVRVLIPVIVLACPQARFQPVYVGDVVRAFLAALEERESRGKRYDLGEWPTTEPQIYPGRA